MERPTGGIYSGQGNNNEKLGQSMEEETEKKVSETGTDVGNQKEESTGDGVRLELSDAGKGMAPTPTPNMEKPRKKTPFWGKLLGVIGLGIVFGIAASVTMYMMGIITNSDAAKGLATQVEEQIEADVDVDEEEASEATGDADEYVESEIASVESDRIEYMPYDGVADMVEDVMPAVVAITGNYEVTSRDFWGQTYSSQTEGSGSGIIIGKTEDKLLIATNNHVVEDSIDLKVCFIDDSVADAQIKGVDAKMDLAVILVDLDDLKKETQDAIRVANLGDSDSLRVGETAIAIGNALGYGQSVTYGVISALDRTLDMPDGSIVEHLIQTDAAINPGNSGGALLNSKGEVIGINSSKTGGSSVDSVGFAIPISAAEPILSDIATSETRVKASNSKAGFLGIGGVTVDEEAYKMYGIPVGVVVKQVYAGTGADEAGIQPGDVVISVESRIISSMEELREELAYYEAGEYVNVEISRLENGIYTEEKLKVRLVDMETLQNSDEKQF